MYLLDEYPYEQVNVSKCSACASACCTHLFSVEFRLVGCSTRRVNNYLNVESCVTIIYWELVESLSTNQR